MNRLDTTRATCSAPLLISCMMPATVEIKNVVTENVKLTQQINHNMQTIESSAQENNNQI
ncbi:TPA: hypothetical protein P6N95_005360, partial [Pseudomonas aeruginosa]|nr:hypothetical protein [Pseudomonas aeruginosa]HDP4099723.1 hypothetical protein [Pseudomonas aeruginosa]